MPHPNIILIFSDQHRRDWMGCAGCSFVETPHLDALAARGVRFSNAYCNAPLCGPSRMSFLTGRHPGRIGIYINEDCLDSNTPTIPQALGLAGYETVLCGRMHLMGLDQRHGFQKRLVGDICRTLPSGPDTDYGPLAGSASSMRKAIDLAQPGDSPVLRYDEHVTQAAERFLTERSRAAHDTPLFVTVGWYGPHHPFIAPRELYEHARERMAGVDHPVPPLPEPVHPWLRSWMGSQKVTGESAERIAMVRANYAAMISLMDQRIGRVLDAAQALPGETLVVYLSDHGEMAGDQMLFGKGVMQEGSSGVPLIVARLKGEEEGAPAALRRKDAPPAFACARSAVVDAPVSLVDLAPTLVAIAGAKPMPSVDGDDLLPLLANPIDAAEDAWAQRPVFSELKIGPNPPMRMVRRGNLKLCYYHGHPPQLFDLAADPLEQHDLAGDPAFAAVRDELKTLVLKDWDPARVAADAGQKFMDFFYAGGWGRRDDPQWNELWNPAKPVYEFGRVGEPLSWLE